MLDSFTGTGRISLDAKFLGIVDYTVHKDTKRRPNIWGKIRLHDTGSFQNLFEHDDPLTLEMEDGRKVKILLEMGNAFSANIEFQGTGPIYD